MEEQVQSKVPVNDETAAAIEPSADESSTDSADSDSDVGSSPSASPQTSRRHHVDHNGLPYITRLPRHERRRIQLQVRKNRKLALTVNNVMKVVEEVEWRTLCDRILRVPSSKEQEIENECSTDKDRKISSIKWWIMNDPLASWRRITDQLYRHREDTIADKIRHYCEDVTDPSLTLENLNKVLTTVSTDKLPNCLEIPLNVRRTITDWYSNKEEQRQQYLKCFINLSPYATWSYLSSQLHFWEATRAEALAKAFVKSTSEPTLTINNLNNVLESVQDMYWNDVTALLGIPFSKWREIKNTLPNIADRRRGLSTYYVTHHPTPSWLHVADVMWEEQEDTALLKVNSLYLRGSHSKKLEACRQALKDKGSIDQIIMQGIFFGLPRSGKTSTKKRLVGRRAKKHQPSTGVVEKPTHVEIERSTVQFVSTSIWNEVIDLDEEAAMVVEDITSDVARDEHQPSDSNASMLQDASAPVPSKRERNTIVKTIVKKVKSMFQRTPANVQATPQPHKIEAEDGQKRSKHSANPMEILENAIPTSVTFSYKGRQYRWTLYLSDAGGQPEFQEMLPALVSGPSLYFLTFPLHTGLNEKCVVEYQHPDGSSITPFKASFTVKECLLSSLASIASTRSYTRVEDEKAVVPKVLFLATHMDKIDSKQLRQIDQELQEAIKTTAAYEDNMIEFKTEDQMVFEIDNTSNDDDDIKRVREAVERIGTRNDDYLIKTPHTWMIFAITLRHLHRSVIDIEECAEIAKECGIDTREELTNVLWFLHHNIGILRYFQEVPQLRGSVILEPQFIFDKVTKMMISTFTFEAVGHHTLEEFKKKGFIPVDSFQLSTEDADDLTGDKFTVLMEHLNIITPVEENGKVVKYFAPMALSHADIPPQAEAEPIIPPLFITFKSGYCPKGIFGSLVVKLLKPEKTSSFHWRLNQDKIYRDQICISVGPYDSFVFSLHPTFIRVDILTNVDCRRKITLGRVCYDVRREVQDSITSVSESLHYTQGIAHSIAFACTEHQQQHLAAVNFSPTDEPCTLTCPENKLKSYDLSDGHLFWFNEVEEGCRLLTESDLASVQRAVWEGRAKWYNLGLELGIPLGTLDAIQQTNHHVTDDCFRATLVAWLRSYELHPSWTSLARSLRAAPVGLGELADQLNPM